MREALILSVDLGPVWSALYVIIAISFGRVFWGVWKKEFPIIVALPFALNLLFNFAFTPLQFVLKNNYLAGIDIVLVLATLVWAIIAIYPYSRYIAYLQIPYLLWVTFATMLQIAIVFLNA